MGPLGSSSDLISRARLSIASTADGPEQKYGLTHVDTERSMRHDVVSLAGYSIRRGPVPLSRDRFPGLSRSSARVFKPVNKPKRRQDAA